MFKEIRSVNMPHTGRHRHVFESEAVVSIAITASPRKSLRRLCAEMAMPYTTCQHYLKLYPYCMKVFRHYAVCRSGSYFLFVLQLRQGKPHGPGVPTE